MKQLFKTLRFKLFEPRRNKEDSLNQLFIEQTKTLNHYLTIIKELDITNKRELHDLTYSKESEYPVRNTSTLPTAYYQTIRDKAVQTYKSYKNKKGKSTFPKISQIPLILDQRTFRLIETDNRLKYFASITTNQGRIHIPIHTIRLSRYPARYLKYLVTGEIHIVKAELLYKHKTNEFWIYITVKKQQQSKQTVLSNSHTFHSQRLKTAEKSDCLHSEKIASFAKQSIHRECNQAIYSIDMGERNLVTSVSLRTDSPITHSDIHFYKNPRGRLYKYQRTRTSIQKKNRPSKIKSIGNKEKRFIRQTNHNVSKQVLNDILELKKQGYQVTVYIGNLKGIRNQINKQTKKLNKHNNRIQNFSVYPKNLKKRLNNWPFQQLTTFIQYKLEWENINIQLVSEQWTSKRCHKCKSLNTKRPKQGIFKCLECGYQCNSDYNATVNIGYSRMENKTLGRSQSPGAVSERHHHPDLCIQ